MVYKILVVAGSLGVEAIKIKPSLLIFECALEELGAVIDDLDYWIANPPPPPSLALGHLLGTYGIHSGSSGKFLWGVSG